MENFARSFALAILLASFGAGAASAQQRLTFATMSAEGTFNITNMFKPWADRINAASESTIVVEPRAGTILANYGNVLDRVTDDVVQIGWALQGAIAGRFPLTEVSGLPFIAENPMEGFVGMWRLYKSGLLDTEYKDVLPLMMAAGGPFSMHLSKEAPNVTDLRGVRLAASSKEQSEFARRMGGTAISTNTSDVYETIQKGLADGTIMSWGAVSAYKLNEITSFHIEGPFGMTPQMIFMSKKKYDSLPPAARRAIDANSGEAGTRVWAEHSNLQASQARSRFSTDGKRKIHPLTPPEQAVLEKAFEPMTQTWVAQNPGGAAVLAKYKEAVMQVRAEAKR